MLHIDDFYEINKELFLSEQYKDDNCIIKIPAICGNIEKRVGDITQTDIKHIGNSMVANVQVPKLGEVDLSGHIDAWLNVWHELQNPKPKMSKKDKIIDRLKKKLS